MTPERRSLLDGDIVIDSKRYVIDKKKGWLEGETVSLQDGLPEIPVSAEWPIGLPGGMGETQRLSPNSNGSAFSTMDCSAVGFYRLPPRRVSVIPTSAPVDKPTWFREQGGAGVAGFEVVDFTAPNASTGTQTVSHSLNATPKCVILWNAGKTADGTTSANANMSIGWFDGSGNQATIHAGSQDASADAQTSGSYETAACFTRFDTAASPAVADRAIFSSVSSSNFVINWTVKSSSQLRMHALVITGAEVSAFVKNWTALASTGTQSVTGVGFEPDMVLHFTNGAIAVGGGNGANLSFGGMEDSGNQFCILTGSADAGTSSDSFRIQSANECAGSLSAAGAVQRAVRYVSMDNDGFTVNKITESVGAGFLMSSLCIKGVQVKMGVTTKSVAAATASQAAITLPFTTSAFLVASDMDINLSNGLTTSDVQVNMGFGLGMASGTTAVAAGSMFDEDAQATMDSYGVDALSAAFVKINNADGSTIDAVATCGAISMGTAGWLSWTTNDAVATQLFYIALAPLAVAGTDPYILAFNGQRATQMSVAANVITVVDQEDFGVAAQCGHPSKFLGEWYLPLGAFTAFSRLTVISTSGMTWTADASGDVSLAFATIQDGPISKLARGYSTNLVDISVDGATFDASGFNISDTSSFITSMEDSGTQLAVAKSDGNLYIMDATGSPRKASSSPITFSDPDNGCGLVTIEGTNNAVWNTFSALMLSRGSDERPVAFGIDTNKQNRAIPNVSYEPHRGRHYEWWPVEDTGFAYGLYRVTESLVSKTYIDCYEKVGDEWKINPFFRYDGVARGLFCDSRKRLWFAGVSDGTYNYFQLGKDGSPDAGRDTIGFGAASTSYDTYYPRTDFGHSHTLKQFRSIDIKVWGQDNKHTTQLSALIDGGSANNVGSTITLTDVPASSNRGTAERFWTLNSNDTGFDLMVYLNVTTTSAYVNTITSGEWQLHSLRAHAFLRPDGARKVRILIDTEEQYSNEAFQTDAGMDAKMIRDTLFGLERGAPVTVLDPDGNSKTLFVTQVSDLEQDVGTEPTEYKLQLDGVIWVSS